MVNYCNFIVGYSIVMMYGCYVSGLFDNCYGDVDNWVVCGVFIDDVDFCFLGFGGYFGYEFVGLGCWKIIGSGKFDDEGYWYGVYCFDVGNVDGDGFLVYVGCC